MRLRLSILVLALLITAPAACWADTTIDDSIASSYMVLELGHDNAMNDRPATVGSGENLVVGWGWETRNGYPYAGETWGPYLSYLKFPKVPAPSGSVLVSARLFINDQQPVAIYGAGFECRGVLGYDIEFSAVTINSMPPGNTAPASVIPSDYGTYFDVSQIVNATSGEDILFELRAGWSYETARAVLVDYDARHGWQIDAPRTSNSDIRQPRLIFTFDQPGVKRTQITVGVLKAGYGSE